VGNVVAHLLPLSLVGWDRGRYFLIIPNSTARSSFTQLSSLFLISTTDTRNKRIKEH